VAFSFLFASGSNASAEDVAETLKRLIDSGSERETIALEALDWKWVAKNGHCDSWQDALQHKFNDAEPVDEYHGHWQSNRGRSLFEIDPQQDVRVLEGNPAGRTVTTTFGYSAWMFTPDTRLTYKGSAIVERKDRGFGDPVGPYSLPLHGGRFGMGKVAVLRKFADDPAVTVIVEPGRTDLGQEITILTLKTGSKPSKIFPANYTTKYFFENQSHCFLQYETWSGDRLRSKMLVTGTATKQIGDKSIVFPVKFVRASWSTKHQDWRVWTNETTALDIQPIPVEKMILKINKPDLFVSLRPVNGHLRANVDELTPAELDKLSKQLFEEYDKRFRK
jgi:hypothetical protein